MTVDIDKFDQLFERFDRVRNLARDIHSERVFCAHEIARLLQNMDDDGSLWLSRKDLANLVSLTKVEHIDWESL